jgi:hypothetical protein
MVVLVLLPPAAQAAKGPGNSWTQLDTNNWPEGDGANPDCTKIRCVRWPKSGSEYDWYEGQWTYLIKSEDWFHHAATEAMTNWSYQPYRSPVFDESYASCSVRQVCMNTKPLVPKLCGVTTVYPDESNILYRAVIWMNSTKAWSDGPVAGVPCEVNSTSHHEFGHAFAEGHSAVDSDLMYWEWQNLAYDVDADAAAGLRGIYGALSSTSPSNPCYSGQSAEDLAVNCPSLAVKIRLMERARSLKKPPTFQTTSGLSGS